MTMKGQISLFLAPSRYSITHQSLFSEIQKAIWCGGTDDYELGNQSKDGTALCLSSPSCVLTCRMG